MSSLPIAFVENRELQTLLPNIYIEFGRLAYEFRKKTQGFVANSGAGMLVG